MMTTLWWLFYILCAIVVSVAVFHARTIIKDNLKYIAWGLATASIIIILTWTYDPVMKWVRGIEHDSILTYVFDWIVDLLKSPTPEGVWGFFKSYWFWIVLILAGLFFLFGSVTKPWAKAVQGMVVVLAVVIAGAMAVHGIWGEGSSSPKVATREIPLTSSPQSEWPKLVIPAGAKSERIPLPLGMYKIMVAGHRYRLHTVYADGHECDTFGKETCPDGAVVEYYVRNEASVADVISYAFVPK